MKKITSVDALREACELGEQNFFISLAGGMVRSSKNIALTKKGDYSVFNEIDGSEDTLSPEELLADSNIGTAITNGAFYAY